MTALLLLAAAAAAPAPADLRIFGDWAVACDNGRRCEAVSLNPPDAWAGEGQDGPLVVTREAGPDGALTLSVETELRGRGPWRLMVDARTAGMVATADAAGVLATGAAARSAIGRALATGRWARLVAADGTDIARFSLAGSSAAFRYMDDRQGRAGTRGALVATGTKADASPAPALPRVRPVGIDTGPLPGRDQIRAVATRAPCSEERFGDEEAEADSAYPLPPDGQGRARALLLTACGRGAYNFTSAVHLGTREADGWRFEPAPFDLAYERFDTLPVIVNGDFDSASGILSAYAKGRGIGDCGTAHRWAWDGTGFRLIDMSAMTECRGTLVWPTLWRAELPGR